MILMSDSMNLPPNPSASTVLVLTEPADTTADLVVKELHDRGRQCSASTSATSRSL